MTPWDDLPAVKLHEAFGFHAAGATVDHNLYVLHCVIADLAESFSTKPTERRFISASKDEISLAIESLRKILGEIERADTCQVER